MSRYDFNLTNILAISGAPGRAGRPGAAGCRHSNGLRLKIRCLLLASLYRVVGFGGAKYLRCQCLFAVQDRRTFSCLLSFMLLCV